MFEGRGLCLRLWVLGFGYFFIGIFPYVVPSFRDLLKMIFTPYVFDLLICPFLLGLALYSVYSWLIKEKDHVFLRFLFIFLLIFCIEGYGLHWAANTLNSAISSIVGVDEGLKTYVYFLDEHLGHWLIFYSLYGILTYFLFVSIFYDRDEEIGGLWLIHQFTAFMFGFCLFASAMEGQIAHGVIITGLILVVVPIVFLRKSFREVFRRRALISFMFTAGLSILTFTLIYWMLFQGFPQPSEWINLILNLTSHL